MMKMVLLFLVALFLAPPLGADQAEYLGRFIWKRDVDHHGGFSALDLGPNGESFTALSDRARIATGRLIRENDQITGVETGYFGPLRTPNGAPMPYRLADSEGLAISPNGMIYVSFEGQHRIWRYAGPNAAAQNVTPHPAFGNLQVNSGLEALAIDDKGALYTIPERSGGAARPFPVYRYRNGKWDIPFAFPRRGRYLPVGADFGPDGMLYVLERRFLGPLGFSSRVRRFVITDKGIEREETVLRSHNLTHDNLEGISVWRDDSGAIRLTLISDDNFVFLQVTEFVEYRLTQ